MSSGARLHMSVNEDGEERYDEREDQIDGEIPRGETLHRIAYTVLFALIAGALRTVLALIVVFELLYTLVTRLPPGLRVRALANRIITYHYRVLRYLTYNESTVPFPFSDFPEPLEPDAFRAGDRDSDALDR